MSGCVDLVLEGGGVNGIALVGAIAEMAASIVARTMFARTGGVLATDFPGYLARHRHLAAGP
ncbi:hypothetical protein [Actinomadura chokoriensis]|uniref:Uncharacterized protein n=1 Tax=Actinomadura chokoriensis TaxID=454156 RepID=A0ABV4R183_9ACTN